MKTTNIVEYLFKGISLFILDIVTFLLVFSVWALINIRVFPLAFFAILFSLIMVNVVIIASKYFIKIFGVGVYASILTNTIIYYMFVMLFTGITYIEISSKWYMISFLFATLIYITIVFGLYVSGMNKNKDMQRQEIENNKVLDITMKLMNINESIIKSSELVEKSYYTEIIKSFSDMEERLKSSTPFGRITKPIVQNVENKIISKLSDINDEAILLKTLEENQKVCKSIIEALNDVKSLIINREKLIIQ